MANNVDNATEGSTEGSAAKVYHVFTNVPRLAQAFLDLCLEEVTKEGYQGGTSSVASDGSKKKRKKVVDKEESNGVQKLIGVVKNLVKPYGT
ncbi:hypothetical protein IFM89_029876 [Coptis chinensis]|uniref:Uncharacterized protein n=1 Tax=Coptis chinensis TaxID=261450 RepID=A0A835HQP8_9MAGN|nr:hypothetical protein IFM89_029876 [Coptis chinensis]